MNDRTNLEETRSGRRFSEKQNEEQLSTTDSYFFDPGDAKKHLILYHHDSGDLYYSQLPEKRSATASGNVDDQDLQLGAAAVEIMAQPCIMRGFLTVLHAITCLVSGFLFAFSVFGSLFSDRCFPHLVNKDGTFIESQPGFAAMCDTVLFGLGLIFVVSLLMCALVQCSLNKPPLVGLSFLLTLFIGAFAIFGGSTFSVHYALWCDSLSQNLLPKHVRCSDAAKEFDRVHKMTDMKGFEFNLEVQQVTCWALFPLTFITALTYALALRWSGDTPSLPGNNRDRSTPSGFYQYVAAQPDSVQADSDPAQTAECDERSPFIRREN